MRQAAKAAAAATHEARLRSVISESSEYRALKFDIARREIADVEAELQARSCSLVGSEAELRERLFRKLLVQIPAITERVPWYAIDEARDEDRVMIQVIEPQQSITSAS